MKFYEALRMLNEYLDEDKFIVPKFFLDDLMYIMKNNIKGQEKNFFNLFVKQLDYILTLSEYGVSKANSNEILKHCTGLSVIHYIYNLKYLIYEF